MPFATPEYIPYFSIPLTLDLALQSNCDFLCMLWRGRSFILSTDGAIAVLEVIGLASPIVELSLQQLCACYVTVGCLASRWTASSPYARSSSVYPALSSCFQINAPCSVNAIPHSQIHSILSHTFDIRFRHAILL